MYHVFLVQVIDSFQCLSNYESDDILAEFLIQTCLQHLCQATSVHVLQENPESIVVKVAVEIPNDLVTLANSHHCNFISHTFLLFGSLHRLINIFKCVLLCRFLAFLRD